MDTQITVRLSESLVTRLDRLARERGVRRSALVREALRAYLEGGAFAAEERPFDRVRDLAGLAYGGPADLAARHREYLKEVFRAR